MSNDLPPDPPEVRAALYDRVWLDPAPFEMPFELPGVGRGFARFWLFPETISSLEPFEPLAECELTGKGLGLARGNLSLEGGMHWEERAQGVPATALDIVAMRLTELVTFVHGHCPAEVTAVKRLPSVRPQASPPA